MNIEKAKELLESMGLQDTTSPETDQAIDVLIEAVSKSQKEDAKRKDKEEREKRSKKFLEFTLRLTREILNIGADAAYEGWDEADFHGSVKNSCDHHLSKIAPSIEPSVPTNEQGRISASAIRRIINSQSGGTW